MDLIPVAARRMPIMREGERIVVEPGDPVPDFAADEPVRRLDIPIQGFHQRRLAAAALPGDPIDLILSDLEIHVVDGLDDFSFAKHI